MTDFISRESVLQILSGKSAPWDAYQKIKSLPASDVRPKWISVKEQLPKDGEFVLVCNDDGHMMIAKHESETYEWYYKYTNYDFDVWDNEEQGPVCYWMPFPTEPPNCGARMEASND